jgi:hypothetical protein
MPSRSISREAAQSVRRGAYPWPVIIAAILSCLAALTAYGKWGPALILRLAASPLSIEGEFDDFGASLNRAVLAGLSDRSADTIRVFLLGSSHATAAFASPQSLADELNQGRDTKVEVVLLAHRGQTETGSVVLASLAKATPQDLIVLGVTDFDLLGAPSGRVGNFDVLGRLIPDHPTICRIRACPPNELFLLQRLIRASLQNLLTGKRPAPVSGLSSRDDPLPLLDKQRERLVRGLARKLKHGLDAQQVAEFDAMISDLSVLAPGRVVAVRMPISSNLVLSERQLSIVSQGHTAILASLSKAGVPFISDLAKEPIAPDDFSDVLHVWPDVAPRLMGDVLAPALKSTLFATPEPQ